MATDPEAGGVRREPGRDTDAETNSDTGRDADADADAERDAHAERDADTGRDADADAKRDAHAARAADGAADPIIVLDENGRVVYANRATHQLLLRDRIESDALDTIIELDEPSTRALLTSDPHRMMALTRPELGEPVEVEICINPAESEPGRRWVLVMHPLPRQELSIRELLRRATHDDLTTLANRSFLLERVEATFRDPRTADLPHALVMMDLDGFKHVNDSWGHDAGDAVLIAVAFRLRGLCRPGDVVARLGGDEFAAWCRNVGDGHVAGLASRLATVFHDPVTFGDLDLTISGSVGATTSSFARDPNELLRQADAAMYRAKAAGPGHQVVFDAAMAAELRERGTRERELRDALHGDQFVLHYQPVIELGSGTVVGVEALARWQHPRLGELQPADFLPLVDSTLLGTDFDAAILGRACRQLADWRRNRSEPLSMWVNVSPRHLGSALVDRLAGLIADLDLVPGDVVLELTEEASVATPERIEVLETVHALGVRIAVDDFGTGYSQLSYLPEVPLDLVKLDRSFVQGISHEPDRHSLASSVISLAHALDAEVVAEGVESRADLEVLEQLGCDHAQGFLLARPAPAGDVPGVDFPEVIDLR